MKTCLMAALLVLAGLQSDVLADTNSFYYGTRQVDGKTYHVYLHDYGGRAELWFRVRKDASTNGDIKVLDLVPQTKSVPNNTTLQQFAKTLCTVKSVYDGGKTVLGCASVAGSAVCLSASVPTGGVAAVACTTTFRYAATKGLVDCVDGISDWIASSLGKDRDWALFKTGVNISDKQWLGALNSAVDAACAEMRK